MFTPSVMVIEILKIAHFFVYSTDGIKQPVTILAKYLSVTERFRLALSDNAMDYCYVLLGYNLPSARCQPLKI